MRHTSKNSPRLVKNTILGKMRHTGRNAPHLENSATLKKMCQTWKTRRHLKKCGTVCKMRQPLKKSAKFNKIHHTWENTPHLENCATLRKILHPWKNAAQLIKCSFHRKPRPSRVSWKCAGLENISQVAGYWPKVGGYHAALKTLWAPFWVLKLAGAIFWPRSSKPSVRSFNLSPFHRKPSPSRISLECPGL